MCVWLDAIISIPLQDLWELNQFSFSCQDCFLQGGRGHKSGILQRFIAPHGGGKHNSQIRATWTPKLCVLERRRTKQELHDTRFALCERAITFDGPDVHSVSVPLCGTVLAGRVESICNEIVWRISSQSHCVSTESIYIDDPSEPANSISIERMVVNFKVDGNGNIWILWMNSIIPCRQHGFAVDRNDRAAAAVPLADTTNNPNISPAFETVVRLPQTTKLSQEPNHCADKKPVNNSAMQATCPSCGKDDGDPHFQATPYKTIITHFEKTMAMLEADKNTNPRIFWPPKRQFIQAAGGVGFGCLPSQLRKDGKRERSQFSEETHIIPPVIREVHPNLKAKSYSISRDDPLFLSKTCSICETCFLSYTRTMSNLDFQKPVDPLPHITNAKYDFPAKVGNRKSAYKAEKTSGDSNKTPLFDVVLPSLPSPIASPPAEREASEKKKDSLRQSNTTSYFTLDDKDGEKKLGHLIMQGGAAVSREKRRLPCRRRNPYRENLERIAD